MKLSKNTSIMFRNSHICSHFDSLSCKERYRISPLLPCINEFNNIQRKLLCILIRVHSFLDMDA
uniref:Uncharacterized protein n=1 Tax=Amphimedon queenslandica TaxID=400682 RepID=A0A1X7SDV8_AMPQE